MRTKQKHNTPLILKSQTLLPVAQPKDRTPHSYSNDFCFLVLPLSFRFISFRIPFLGQTNAFFSFLGQTNNRTNEKSNERITAVAIRMRPLQSNHEKNAARVWKALPKFTSVTQTTVDGKPLAERILHRNFFTFDQTFGEDASTRTVYDSVVKPIVHSACTAGLNGTVFAYGQTSSGKTFTMQGSGTIAQGSAGTADETGGIVHMAAQDVFRHVAAAQQATSKDCRHCTVKASFLEIYNEEVRDLLDDNRPLQIREDPRRGVFVQCQEVVVTDFQSLLQLLFQGEKSRAFASTAMNERSSRSHTIFRITIESRQIVSIGGVEADEGDENSVATGGNCGGGEELDDGAMRVSTLNLVDLAGSESVRHTGATGDRQKEGGMINQRYETYHCQGFEYFNRLRHWISHALSSAVSSLLTLSRVMKSLGTPNQTHINFRDSKLTRILQPSLSGNARMAVVCCITPSELYLEETRSTLQFAQRAKLVKTNAQVNEVLDDRSIIRRLQRELAESRRYGGGAEQVEHVKMLKLRAISAEADALRANGKIQQLSQTFLDGKCVLFVDHTSSRLETAERPKKRPRRQSEGDVCERATNLQKPFENDIQVANSATKMYSRSSELDLLRDALIVKRQHISVANNELNTMSVDLKQKENELVTSAEHTSQLLWDQEKDAATIECLKTEILDLQSHCDATMKAMKDKLEQRLSQLELEKAERLADEKSNGLLREETILVEKTKDCEMALLQEKCDLQQDNIGTLSSLNDEWRAANIAYAETVSNLESTISQLRDDNAHVCMEKAADRELYEMRDSTKDEELLRCNEKIDGLSSALEQSNVDHSSTQEHVSTLEAQIGVLSQALENSNSDNASASLRVETLENELRVVTLNAQQLTETIYQIKEEVSSTESRAVAANELLDLTKTELESFAKLLLEKELVLASLSQTNLDHCVARASAELESRDLQKTLDSLTEEVAALTATIQDFETKAIESQNQMAKNEAELYSRSTQMESSQREVHHLQEALEIISIEKSRLDGVVHDLSKRCVEAENERTSLMDDFSGMNCHVDLLKEEVGRLEKKRESLECQLSIVEENERKSSDLLASMTVQLQLVEGKNESLSETIDSLHDSLQEMERKLTSTTEDFEIATHTLQNTKADLDDSTSKAVSLEAAILSLQADKNAAASLFDKVEKENDFLSKKLSECEVNISFDSATISYQQEQVHNLEEKLLSMLASLNQSLFDRAQSLTALEKGDIKLSGLSVVVNQLLKAEDRLATKLNQAHLENASAEICIQIQDRKIKENEARLLDASEEADACKKEIHKLSAAFQEQVHHSELGENENNCLLEEVAKLRGENQTNLDRIDYLCKTLVEAERQFGLLQNAALSEKRAAEKLEISDLMFNALVVVLQKAETDSSSRVAQLGIQIESVTTELAASHFSIQSIREETDNDLKESQRELVVARDALRQQLQLVESLQDDLNECYNRINDIEKHHGELLAENQRNRLEVDRTTIAADKHLTNLREKITNLDEANSKLLLERNSLVQCREADEQLASELLCRIVALVPVNTDHSDNVVTTDVSGSPRVDAVNQEHTSVSCETNSLGCKLVDALARLDVIAAIGRKIEDLASVAHESTGSLQGNILLLQQQVNEQVDALEYHKTMMSTLEQEILQLRAECAATELNRQGLVVDNEATLKETVELKMLLADANHSVDEARKCSNAASLDSKENAAKLEMAYDKIRTLEEKVKSMSEMSNRENTTFDIAELQRDLDENIRTCENFERERQAWKTIEADLKLQMGNEQRSLLREGQKAIDQLSEALRTAETETERLKMEACRSREVQDNFQDDIKRHLANISKQEHVLQELEHENGRLRRSSNRLDSEKHAELLQLKSAVEQAKADGCASQAANRTLEKNIENHIIENERLKAEETRQRNETARLLNELEDLKLQIKETNQAVKENTELRSKIEQLKAKVRKYAKSKMTTDDVARIQQLKVSCTIFLFRELVLSAYESFFASERQR